MTSLDRIWESPLNEEGWYVTGHGDAEAFVLASVEPRKLFV